MSVSSVNKQGCSYPQMNAGKRSNETSDNPLDSAFSQRGKPPGQPVASICSTHASRTRETISSACCICCLSQKGGRQYPGEGHASSLCGDRNISCCRNTADYLGLDGTLECKAQEDNCQADDVHLLVTTLRFGTASVSIALLEGLRRGIPIPELARSVRTESLGADH